MDIAETHRLDMLSLEREVAYIEQTQGPKAGRRARRLLSAAIDDRRRDLIQARLNAAH